MKRLLIVDSRKLNGVPSYAVHSYSVAEAVNRLTERTIWDELWIGPSIDEEQSLSLFSFLRSNLDNGLPVFIAAAYLYPQASRHSDVVVRTLKSLYPTRVMSSPWRARPVSKDVGP